MGGSAKRRGMSARRLRHAPPPLEKFEIGLQIMQYGDKFGRKFGYLWVGNLAIFAWHFTSLARSLNTLVASHA